VSGAPWENRAVLDVRAEPAAEAGPGGVAVSAEVADFSARGINGLGLTLRIDGVVVAKGFVDLPPGGHAKKRFVHVLPAGGGSAHDVEVEIDGDAYRADDRRITHLELARTVRGQRWPEGATVETAREPVRRTPPEPPSRTGFTTLDL